jgi:hypothetical protein
VGGSAGVAPREEVPSEEVGEVLSKEGFGVTAEESCEGCEVEVEECRKASDEHCREGSVEEGCEEFSEDGSPHSEEDSLESKTP